MKQNPCRYCALSTEYKGRHSPLWKKECWECEPYQKHKEYLQSQRKFTEGEQITTLEELLKQEWVMRHQTTKHIEVIKHTQLANVLNWIERVAFHKAIKKRKRGLALWQEMN